MDVKDEIKKIASEIKEDVIAIRRQLHRNPELSFQEFETSAYIKKSLDEIGVSWVPVAGTGVLATIKGKAETVSNRVIALRADIDALPIQEETGFAFSSVNPGVMHACGHDMHASSLLGVARILKRIKNRFNGTVKLIFQPAEEILPGGALKVIEEGVLLDPKVDAIIGQHVMPSLESGKIGIRRGKMMASMDEIRLNVIGQGGHGAQPHENKDPVVAAASIIISLQQVISRHSDPRIPSVLSFGRVNANGSTNIIPDEVYIEGTFRTMDERWRQEAHDLIKKIAFSVATGLGCSCDIDIRKGYPSLHNHEELTDEIHSYVQEFISKENVVEMDPWMASEDFAYYGREANSCFYMLGTGFPDQANSALHTSKLNINEDCLELSIGLMSFLAIKI